jgi:hypothetical protein
MILSEQITVRQADVPDPDLRRKRVWMLALTCRVVVERKRNGMAFFRKTSSSLIVFRKVMPSVTDILISDKIRKVCLAFEYVTDSRSIVHLCAH